MVRHAGSSLVRRIEASADKPDPRDRADRVSQNGLCGPIAPDTPGMANPADQPDSFLLNRIIGCRNWRVDCTRI